MYTAFATVYDRLMADVDYDGWAGYYRTLMTQYGIAAGKVVECACGTGGLTIPLSLAGYQMTGIDLSADMLFEASQKSRQAGTMIPFVRQDMRQLKLHRSMDAVLCTCDGLNYLEGEQDLRAFFDAAYATLRPGGGLFFDLSTPYKLCHVLGNSMMCDETREIAYLWKNAYRESDCSVHMQLSIFVREREETYRRIQESQRQFGHGNERLREQLALSGFADVQFYGDRNFQPPAAECHRVHVAARKPLDAPTKESL